MSPDHDSLPQDPSVPLPGPLLQQTGPAQQVQLQDVEQDAPGHRSQVITHQHLSHLQQQLRELLWLAPLYLLSDYLKKNLI